MDPSAPIQLANIFDTVGKRTFSKIRKLTQFKGDTLKASEDIALQSREILQTFVWSRTCPHHTNVCKVRRLYEAISPLVFTQSPHSILES